MNIVFYRTKEGQKREISFYSILLLFFWLQGSVMMYIDSAIIIIAGNTVAKLCSLFFYICLSLGAIKTVFRHVKFQDVLLMVAFVFAIGFSYLVVPGNRENIQNLWQNAITAVVPCFFLGLAFDGDEKNLKLMRVASIIAIASSWAYIIYLSMAGRILLEYYLVYSYALLPHTLLLLMNVFKKPSLINVLFSVLGLLYHLSMGARGPIIAIIVFVILLLWKNSNSLPKKVIFIIVIAMVVFSIYYTDLWMSAIIQLKAIVSGMGLSTRVFDAILSNVGEASNDARVRIYKYLWSLIKEQPLTGYGVFGEWKYIYYSAHQVVLELWMHYGMILGSIVVILLAYVFAKPSWCIKDDLAMSFYILLLSMEVPHLIYAGSYINIKVFFMIGFCINQARIAKQKN